MKFLYTKSGTALNLKFIKSIYVSNFRDVYKVVIELDDGGTYDMTNAYKTKEEAELVLTSVVRNVEGL